MRKGLLQNHQNILRLSYIFALWYWFNCESGDAHAVLAKVSSTALLTLYAYKTSGSPYPTLTVMSLASHCVGDGAFECDTLILPAMGAFLMGHFFYIFSLRKNCIRLQDINLTKALGIVAFSLYGIAFTSYLMTKTSGVIQCAIPLYSAVLSAMFTLACLQKKNTFPIFISALLYVASDNLNGFNMFVKKIPYAGFFTWASYYLAVRMMAELQKKSENKPQLSPKSAM